MSDEQLRTYRILGRQARRAASRFGTRAAQCRRKPITPPPRATYARSNAPRRSASARRPWRSKPRNRPRRRRRFPGSSKPRLFRVNSLRKPSQVSSPPRPSAAHAAASMAARATQQVRNNWDAQPTQAVYGQQPTQAIPGQQPTAAMPGAQATRQCRAASTANAPATASPARKASSPARWRPGAFARARRRERRRPGRAGSRVCLRAHHARLCGNTVGVGLWGMVFPVLTIVVTQLAGAEQAGMFSLAFVTALLLMFVGNYGVRNFQASDLDEVLVRRLPSQPRAHRGHHAGGRHHVLQVPRIYRPDVAHEPGRVPL